MIYVSLARTRRAYLREVSYVLYPFVPMIFDLVSLSDSVVLHYPDAEISWYWSQDDLLSFIHESAVAVSDMSHHVATLNSGGVSIILSIHHAPSYRSVVSRLSVDLAVNRIYFSSLDIPLTNEDLFVRYMISLLDSVL